MSRQFASGFGRSKYVDKKYNSTSNVIYSRNTYQSALQKCCTFLNFCKENFHVRNLSDLKSEYFNSFVESKKYAKNTANVYKWALKKLQTGYNTFNSAEYIWISEDFERILSLKSNKSRIQMSKDIHDKIIEKAYSNKFENGLALDISRSLGLRVSEITNIRINDFRFDRHGRLNHVYIHRSKGGRNRKIPYYYLTQDQRDRVIKLYKYFKDSRGCHDRLFTNKADSYRKAFANARKEIAPEFRQCSIHSLRKEFANDYFYREISKGRPEKEVKQELTELLGHSRIDVLKHYISYDKPILHGDVKGGKYNDTAKPSI